MARELVVLEWCDVCLGTDGEKVDVTFSEEIEIAGVRRRLALCGQHQDPVAQVALLLADYGTLPDGTPTLPVDIGDERCELCDRNFKTQRGLSQHMTKTHGGTESALPSLDTIDPEDYEAARLLIDKLPYSERKAQVGRFGKLVCGADTNVEEQWRGPDGTCKFRSNAPQGITAHRRTAHGVLSSVPAA